MAPGIAPTRAATFASLVEEDAVLPEAPAPVDFDPSLALAQIGDPAIETVDEMTVGAAPGSGRTGSLDDGSFARQLGQRFANAQDPAIETVDEQTFGGNDHSGEREWFEQINIRGYTQFRINDTLWYDPDGAGPYHPNDKSVGPNNNFYIRRCRLIFSGDLSDRLYFYIQPDFASGLSGVSDPGAINYAQLRDCYGDCYITTDKVHRVRVGQSKVPYGWDNMQSSSNRLPLDRADFINATKSERGLRVFYYWTPIDAQELYKFVLDRDSRAPATTACSVSAATTARATRRSSRTTTCTSSCG